MTRNKKYSRRWPMIWLIDTISSFLPRPNKGAVAVVRLYGIGDALISRPFIYWLRDHVAPRKLVIIGNTSWAAAQKIFFPDIECVFLHEQKYTRNYLYRLRSNYKLRQLGFETAICAMHYRSHLDGDALVYNTGAPERISVEPLISEKRSGYYWFYHGKLSTCFEKLEDYEDRDTFIEHPDRYINELERLEYFASRLAGQTVRLPPPDLTELFMPSTDVSPTDGYAVFFLGASVESRMWPVKNFLSLAANVINSRPDIDRVVLLGGPGERQLLETLRNDLQSGVFANEISEDLQSKIAVEISAGFLADIELIGQSRLFIGNNTSVAHIAAALPVPSIILAPDWPANGIDFGSFVPYPDRFSGDGDMRVLIDGDGLFRSCIADNTRYYARITEAVHDVVPRGGD